MLFNWKNPLKKKHSTEDLHRLREAYETEHPNSGSFVGASLLHKTACVLPAVPTGESLRYEISGSAETLASVTPILLARQAVEQRQSVLLVDFGPSGELPPEPSWHRLWALSFYLDRARAFRIFDLEHSDRSDTLGLALEPCFQTAFPHLAQVNQALDPALHLKTEKGLVVLAAPGKQRTQGQELLFILAGKCLPQADLSILLHLDSLTPEQENSLIDAFRDGCLIIHRETSGERPANASRLMFRQRNSLSQKMTATIKNLASPSTSAKLLSSLDGQLNTLETNQALWLAAGSQAADLVQVTDTDGLPWPPEYRPMRSRHPGT